MLKVTQSNQDGGAVTFKLEGKLIEPWVGEVQRLLAEGTVEPGSQLDLTRVSFVDQSGVDLLQSLVTRGLRIASCSPYVAELLRVRNSHC